MTSRLEQALDSSAATQPEASICWTALLVQLTSERAIKRGAGDDSFRQGAAVSRCTSAARPSRACRARATRRFQPGETRAPRAPRQLSLVPLRCMEGSPDALGAAFASERASASTSPSRSRLVLVSMKEDGLSMALVRLWLGAAGGWWVASGAHVSIAPSGRGDLA